MDGPMNHGLLLDRLSRTVPAAVLTGAFAICHMYGSYIVSRNVEVKTAKIDKNVTNKRLTNWYTCKYIIQGSCVRANSHYGRTVRLPQDQP